MARKNGRKDPAGSAVRDATGQLRPMVAAQSRVPDFISPVVPTKVDPFVEIGASGLLQWSGIVREELLPKLTGVLAIRTYKEMADNDAVVGASLSAIDLMVRRVSWRVEPGGPGSDDKAAADFLESIKDDMAHTWVDHISEAMTMLTFGWSLFEVVYKKRNGPSKDPHRNSRFNDGKIGVRKLGIRAQDTLFRWVFDPQGGLQAMIQRPPPDYWERLIPIDKALLYRVSMRKNNPESRSILRTAYRAWWFKKRIEEIQAIGIERDLAGIPVALVPPQLLSTSASSGDASLLTTIKKIVVNLRNDEQAGVVFPMVYDAQGKPMYDLKLLTTGGRRNFDTTAVLNYYDQRITMAMFTDFMLLGHEQRGTKELGEARISAFAHAMDAYLDQIEDTLNRYLVPRLFGLNGWDVETLPRFKHEPVETINLEALSDYMLKMSQAGMPIFPNETLQRHVLEIADLPSDQVKITEPAAAVKPAPTPEGRAPTDNTADNRAVA